MHVKYPRLVAQQQRALAVIRIGIGAWFLYAVAAKLDPAWVSKFPKVLAEYTATTPVKPYAGFLTDVIAPNAQAFAGLVILGELAAGLGLVLGLFTAPAALLGAFLNLNFGLAAAGLGSAYLGLNLTFVVVQVALAFSYAGTTWGLDRHLVGKLPWWFQGLIHYEYREF